MSITASMVKELRERTGAGMMECKKALVEANGDLDAAAEALRKSGQAKADKKASRVAADGLAKDENFAAFAESIAAVVLASGETDVTTLAETDSGDGRSVEQARTDLIQKVGENISVRRAQIVEADGPIGAYTHGARIGAIVALNGGDEELARDIAMHVAAINPTCIDESGVPADMLEREKRIFSEQAAESGKPPEIVEKMVTGRVAKFLKEITLVGQPFVKDPDVSVGKLLKGADASVVSFVRFEVGEGIEKKEDNFVEEVMAQVQGAG
jgi:elongation factor Ts